MVSSGFMRIPGSSGVALFGTRLTSGVRIAGSALVIAVLAASCTKGGDTEPGPSENVRYMSVHEIRELVEDNGIPCTDWGVINEPIGAQEVARCTGELGFSVYSDPVEVADSVESTAKFLNERLNHRSVHLVGENWLVNCSQEPSLCEELSDVLGGRVDVRDP